MAPPGLRVRTRDLRLNDPAKKKTRAHAARRVSVPVVFLDRSPSSALLHLFLGEGSSPTKINNLKKKRKLVPLF